MSNERLHCALTSPSFRLAAAFSAQVADTFAPEDPRPALRRPAARSGAGATPSSLSRISPAASTSNPEAHNLRVMEGVQENAYRCVTIITMN